ncbi:MULTISPECIES: MFS transporter [unclassified Rathayibacter]|uniref:MFS transporter n=1 Tax=unclassified Rathayibacter TaxID=2609250 RepID=UPI001FC95D77|nr:MULTISPECIES: MFS transporter [unclassified Rathayibacter]
MSGPGITARRGRVGVAAVALGSFAIVLSEFLPIGLLPAIASDLDVGIGTAGSVVVVTGLFAALAAPLVTVATSRFDRRTVLVALSALLVVSDALAALAPTFPVLLAARALLGVSLGGFWAIGMGIGARLVPPAGAVRAVSMITAGISVATVVSLPLSAAVSALADWRLAFVIGGAIGLVALALQLATLPPLPSTERVRFASLGGLLRVPRARVGLLGAAVLFFAQFAAYTYITPFLQTRAGLGPEAVTVALLLFGVAGIAGNFTAGATVTRSVRGTTGTAQIALAAAVVLLPFLAPSSVGVVALVLVWGFVWGGLPLALQTWMSTATPAGSETALALFVTTIQLALAAGSIVGGGVVTATGLDGDFRLAGGIALVGALAFLALTSRRRSSAPSDAAARSDRGAASPRAALPRR